MYTCNAVLRLLCLQTFMLSFQLFDVEGLVGVVVGVVCMGCDDISSIYHLSGISKFNIETAAKKILVIVGLGATSKSNGR